MMRWLIYCAAGLAACTPPPEPVNGDIAGAWHGQRWEGQARVHWLSRIADDGELDIRFMTCFNGEVVRTEHQYGHGQLTDGVFRIELAYIDYPNTQTGEIEQGEGFDHDYAMTELTAERMRYYSTEHGERYEALRVANDFEPQCAPATLNVRTEPGSRRAKDAWITRMVDEPEDEDDEIIPDLENADP